ncbi:MAG: hypothetical protein Q4B36_04735 [Tissierellia bacterium]|nr:hypothetical protein [Tissierellia bacterium]
MANAKKLLYIAIIKAKREKVESKAESTQGTVELQSTRAQGRLTLKSIGNN